MPYIDDEYIMRQNMMCLFLRKSIEEFSRKKVFKIVPPSVMEGRIQRILFFSIKEVACPIFARCSTFFFFLKRNKKQKGECTRVRGNKS